MADKNPMCQCNCRWTKAQEIWGMAVEVNMSMHPVHQWYYNQWTMDFVQWAVFGHVGKYILLFELYACYQFVTLCKAICSYELQYLVNHKLHFIAHYKYKFSLVTVI